MNKQKNVIQKISLRVAAAVRMQVLCLLAAALPFTVLAHDQTSPDDLADASLEQLMNVSVTSVSKKEQKISHVASSIYVINKEDIKRSGATNIPDLLRLAPGIDVGQLTDFLHAVSVRGFENVWANKLLVLIDGRSVYNNAISGTIWDAEDVPLADIERIEVIRGPGATIWGANAVNGVINIITKDAATTHGGYVEGLAGNGVAEQTFVRYGATLGEHASYRFFGDSDYLRATQATAIGTPPSDGGYHYHLGFRADWDPTTRDTIMLQGDWRAGSSYAMDSFRFTSALQYIGLRTDSYGMRSADALVRWTRRFSPASSIELQAYVDHFDMRIYGAHQKLTTGDAGFQHRITLGSRNDLIWGVEGRVVPGWVAPGYIMSFSPNSMTNWLAGAFVQDEWKINQSLWFTAGVKFESNSYVKGSVQPSARLLWTVTPRTTLWSSVSRALREPSWEDTTINIVPAVVPLPGNQLLVVQTTGYPKATPEQLTAYEAGCRYEPAKSFSLDISTFYNVYSRLNALYDLGPITPDPNVPGILYLQTGLRNWGTASSYGFELSTTFSPTRNWRLVPGYAFYEARYGTTTGTPAFSLAQDLGEGTKHQFQVHSYWNISRGWSFDPSFYYVSALADAKVPAYSRFDARLVWRVSDHWEFSVAGQNLLTPKHTEFSQTVNALTIPVVIGPTAYLKASYSF